MSAAENQKLLEDIFTGLAANDTALFVASLAEDVTMRVTGRYSWSRVFQGKSALRQDLYGRVRSRLAAPGRMIAKRIIAGDDHVVVEAEGDMQVKDGRRYDNEYCLVFRLQHGKIVELREYCDSLLAETVLGPYQAPADAAPADR